ncbi:GAF domain-containing protein [Clostridium algidicarnis]|uniref:GAF domain-containing protein n=1 Tax=Clostridium algidicarnis DSM 15099 TaxID=1121295 RepID=A0A2S6FXC1_9CLOT|nr:GAF domain-containing protein [Clostridium algidicarnis]PPK48164.1 GAF domain-containing protein [Clostridium algidicarnis DSM 15099]
MIKLDVMKKMTKEEKYKYMLILIEGQLSSEKNIIASLCNISAIINSTIDRCNWVGFYIYEEEKESLVLGPFQGRPACNRIDFGKGVCGTAIKEKKPLRIENVNEFEGHIACDSASNSEIVIPIIKGEKIYGVLDIDSPEVGRFSELEEIYLKKAVEKIVKYI